MGERTPDPYDRTGWKHVQRVELLLDDCLKQMLLHHASPCACLGAHPEVANELAPLLELASSIAELPDADPSPEFKQRTRRLLLGLREPPARHHSLISPFPRPRKTLARLVLGSGIALLLFAASSGGIIASERALPGTPLYSVKRHVESVELALAHDSASQASVHFMLAERRLDEVVELADGGSQNLAEQTVLEYDAHMSSALEDLEKANDDVKSPVIETFGERLAKRHQELREKEEKVEEPAKIPLQRALSITDRGIERVNRMRSAPHGHK